MKSSIVGYLLLMLAMIVPVAANATMFSLDARANAEPPVIGNLKTGDCLDLTLSDDISFSLTVGDGEPVFSGMTSFVASVDGDETGGAVIVQSDSGLQIDLRDSQRHLHYLVSVSASGVKVSETTITDSPCACAGTLQPPSHEEIVPTASYRKSVLMATSSANDETSSDPATNVYVDLLIAYDSDAAKWVKNEWVSESSDSLTQFAVLQVVKMNAVLKNTHLTEFFRFRLVGVQEIGMSANGNLYTALSNITNDNWRVVKEMRDKVEADVVCMLVDNGESLGYTGLGFSLDSYNYTYFSEYAYNACQVRAVANGHTMTHEVGHNLGAGHPDNLKISPGPQYYPWSSGYYFTGTDKVKYFTVMGYNNDGWGGEELYEQAPYFSSPYYFYKGVPVGTASNDNTVTIYLNYKTVSRYRGSERVDDVGKAIDAPNYVWDTSAYFPWSVYYTNGVYCARSCDMDYMSTSWLRTYVAGPATLSFRYMLCSPSGTFSVKCGDRVLFTRTETKVFDMAWTNQTVSIPAETNAVVFSYAHAMLKYKDMLNGVVLDQVSLRGGSPVNPEDDPEIEPEPEPEPDSEELYLYKFGKLFTGATTYNGWVRSLDDRLVGVISLTAGAASKLKIDKTGAVTGGESKLSGTYTPFRGTKQKLTFASAFKTNSVPTVELWLGETETIRLAGLSARGETVDLQLGKDLLKSKDNSEKSNAKDFVKSLVGTWSFAFKTDASFAAFTLTASANGKGTLAGVMPDATKVSVSVQGIIGDQDGDGYPDCIAYPFAYHKAGKASLAFVFWLNDERAWISDIADAADTTGTVEIDSEVGPSTGNGLVLADGAYTFLSLTIADEVVSQAFTVENGKWVVPKQNKKTGANPYGLKLTYKAKDGSVTGSFKANNAAGKSTAHTFNGRVVNGVLYGSVTAKDGKTTKVVSPVTVP